MHPAVRILAYALSALVVPGLSHFQLGVVCGVALLADLRHLRGALTLLRRARWLFLLMLLAYAYQIPGDALWPDLGDFSPSRAGALEGLLQASRLAALLLLLHILVLRLPAAALLTGIHSVLRPLAMFGLDPQRAALRLALTLQAMDQPPGWKVLARMLHDPAAVPQQPLQCRLQTRPLLQRDWLALSLLLAGFGMWVGA